MRKQRLITLICERTSLPQRTEQLVHAKTSNSGIEGLNRSEAKPAEVVAAFGTYGRERSVFGFP